MNVNPTNSNARRTFSNAHLNNNDNNNEEN